MSRIVFDKALRAAQRHSYAGTDPFDALSSQLLNSLGSLFGRPFRLLATQAMKRLPIDCRRILKVSAQVNSKALALFLSSAARAGDRQLASELGATLIEHRARHVELCWGYPFPWQARAFYLPAGTPTVVATAFAIEALVDLHEATGTPTPLQQARIACRFFAHLHRTEDKAGTCLSYSPVDHSAVYNASLLAVRAQLRAAVVQDPTSLRSLVGYVLERQRPDGSWGYGDASHHQWVDNFHTGFVLGALDVYRRATGDPQVREAVIRGAEFWEKTFFGPGGEPYYYAHRRYPYDVHGAAQAVLTFLQLRDNSPRFREAARRTARWMVTNLMDPDGSFYYQVRRTHTVRIRYMRWSQAWATRALAEMVHAGVDL